MATASDSIADVTEECDTCERTTPHRVDVQLLTESRTGENTEYSREPYRVSECQVCGSSTALRMNNA